MTTEESASRPLSTILYARVMLSTRGCSPWRGDPDTGRYHHVADRNDLLAAAAPDHVIACIVTDLAAGAEPRPALRGVAVGLFDAIVTPGSAPSSTESPGGLALDIYESISEHLQALDVPTSVVRLRRGAHELHPGRRAERRQRPALAMDRSAFLAHRRRTVGAARPREQPDPCTEQDELREHYDREQFLAGIETANRAAKDSLPG